jgi:hypothetical protein
MYRVRLPQIRFNLLSLLTYFYENDSRLAASNDQ